MTVHEATSNDTLPMIKQEEKSLESPYEMPEEFKRWYDQLHEHVLAFHFRQDISSNGRPDLFVRKLYAGEVLWRRGYDREVLRNEKWRMVKNISKELEVVENPVLYKRVLTRKGRLTECIWLFFTVVLTMINIYYVFYGINYFESNATGLIVVIFTGVMSVLGFRQWSIQKVEKSLSKAMEKQKILSERLSLIKEKWGEI